MGVQDRGQCRGCWSPWAQFFSEQLGLPAFKCVKFMCMRWSNIREQLRFSSGAVLNFRRHTYLLPYWSMSGAEQGRRPVQKMLVCTDANFFSGALRSCISKIPWYIQYWYVRKFRFDYISCMHKWWFMQNKTWMAFSDNMATTYSSWFFSEPNGTSAEV